MLTSGCEVKMIPNMKFNTIETPHAVDIINGLIQSGIQYSAKYNDEKLTLVYSFDEQKKIDEILNRMSSDNADYVERLRRNGGSNDEYMVLIPEVAEIMGLSASSLENRPSDLRLYLAQVYVNNWFCDKTTIQKELSKVSDLGYFAQNEVIEAEQNELQNNNTPENRKDIHEMEQRLDRAAVIENELLKEQRERVINEENRVSRFSRKSLKLEAMRIKQQSLDMQNERKKQQESELGKDYEIKKS